MQPSLCSEYSEEFLWRKTQNICVFTQPFPVRSRVLDMETNRNFGGLCNSSLQAELPTKVYTTRDLQSDWRKGKLGVAYYLEKSLPEGSRKFTGRIPERGRKGATGPLSSEAAEIGNSPRPHQGWHPHPSRIIRNFFQWCGKVSLHCQPRCPCEEIPWNESQGNVNMGVRANGWVGERQTRKLE